MNSPVKTLILLEFTCVILQNMLKIWRKGHIKYIASKCQYEMYTKTVELQWLEHLWNHENMFETEVVRANEC